MKEESSVKAIERAIKSVAVGKKGSRSLEPKLIDELFQEVSTSKQDRLQCAVLCTSLMYKGASADEQRILEHFTGTKTPTAQDILRAFVPDIASFASELILKILEGDYLTRKEAHRLGSFYFDNETYSSEQDDHARSLSAVWLRMRYAQDEEYLGFYDAFIETFKEPFRKELRAVRNRIQITEPFDGVASTPLMTPAISAFLQTDGFQVVSLVGDSSGPKFGVNLKKLALELNKESQKVFLKSNQNETLQTTQPFGFYIDNADISESWVHWVGLRKRFLKRPFMATLEKFTNVSGAAVSITSAFHEPFLRKMLALGEGIGYPGNIVVRKGREGSLAFSLSKPVVIECSVVQKDGTYKRHSFEYSLKDLNKNLTPDGRAPIDLEENTRLMKNYIQNGTTDNESLDLRIYLTNSGLHIALKWVMENMYL